MSNLSAFIESDAFFPILILLLVLLILVFIWLFVSNQKGSKKKSKNKNTIEVDNDAEIKIVPTDEIIENNKPIVEEKEIVSNTEEVKIVKDVIEEQVSEVTENVNVVLTGVVEDKGIPKEDLIVDIKVPNQDASSFEIPKKIDDGDPGEEVNIELTQPSDETNISDQHIDIGLTSMMPKENDQGEEFEVPKPVDDGDIGTPAYKMDAFNFKPNENHDINEDVKVEMPHEYTGEKTEIFNFNFDEEVKENKDIESEIIDAANKYIENIMKKVDGHEEKN